MVPTNAKAKGPTGQSGLLGSVGESYLSELLTCGHPYQDTFHVYNEVLYVS